ncbi:hypothetical protein KIH74_28390 [Kineosporia sp. J2-2]|uniref:Uncharacterized protein n=1 Tax=Kineosporia corallincola TaxID=2835133 RepID=A0ABS5TP75_9ACTN|nr:hypothetical protein [Kineosporia corallincola]MBT0772895.1 hypothetical protein [Kineosporia corallincola]
MVQYLPTGPPAGGHAFAFALPGFDHDAWNTSRAARAVELMQAPYREHPDDGTHPDVIAYWARRGVHKEVFGAGTPGEYAVLAPSTMDSTQLYPLVYVSHGGGDPINKAETTGFGALVGREQLIAVFPWNGGRSNDDVEREFPRILGELERRGYPVDRERIYATGFSAGSDATGVLACVYPDVLAAVAPCPAGNLFAKGRWFGDPESYRRNAGVRLPFVAVAGTMDGGDRYPLEAAEHLENFSIWMREIVHVPGFTAVTLEESRRLVTGDDETSRAFGLPFHRTFSTMLEDVRWLFGDYLDEAGRPVARFVTGVGLPHVQTAVQAPLVWDFLKHFRRDTATGASIRVPVVVTGVDPVARRDALV